LAAGRDANRTPPPQYRLKMTKIRAFPQFFFDGREREALHFVGFANHFF